MLMGDCRLDTPNKTYVAQILVLPVISRHHQSNEREKPILEQCCRYNMYLYSANNDDGKGRSNEK